MIKIEYKNSHIEVYNNSKFLFSVDNELELSNELKEFKQLNYKSIDK